MVRGAQWFGASLLFLVFATPVIQAGDFRFLPSRTPYFSGSALDFRFYIYTGYENSRVVDRGNLGLEFPLLVYTPLNLSTGIAAATQLVMYPKSGMVFPVDNFYATLAAYFNYAPLSTLTLRLYPVYHVSAHLADGSTDIADLTHRIPVSGEMAKLETEIKPVPALSLSLGYGRYYHVCVQKNLTDRADMDLQLHCWPKGIIRPFFTISGQIVHMSAWDPGVDLELGTQISGISHHAIGVGLRYFDHMSPGFNYAVREKGIGLQIDFIP